MAKFAQKKSEQEISSIWKWFFFNCHNAKIHPKRTIDHEPPTLSSTQLHFWYHQKPHHDFLISQTFWPTEQKLLDLKRILSLEFF